ncbi:MAG: low specificity L-threonine aldolase [Lachnospiraceae bacterium]|nr:low specificity L-threonine aldolase [Lachnospiraceae bacterium]
MDEEKLGFACDYMKGAHPNIMKAMTETNMISTVGYGKDEISERARERVRKVCGCPKAAVEFLVGGTQTNAVVIDAFLRPYQGVIAAETGHIGCHEAGAIEFGGHKVLTLKQKDGKISPEQVERYLEDFYNDESFEHMVMPGMVYLSQPTEYGTLYTKEQLQAFRRVCDAYHIPLYVDGARLAYALACPENDVSLKDMASLCDAFYIGGTKCGAMFGEAVVIPDPNAVPYFFTIIKQHGALLAKGRLLGLQFDELFKDDLYLRIGQPAIKAADQIREALQEKGYQMIYPSFTNQSFCVMENEKLQRFGDKVSYSFWEKYDDSHTVIRLATDWAAAEEETQALIDVIRKLA